MPVSPRRRSGSRKQKCRLFPWFQTGPCLRGRDALLRFCPGACRSHWCHSRRNLSGTKLWSLVGSRCRHGDRCPSAAGPVLRSPESILCSYQLNTPAARRQALALAAWPRLQRGADAEGIAQLLSRLSLRARTRMFPPSDRSTQAGFRVLEVMIPGAPPCSRLRTALQPVSKTKSSLHASV